MRAHHPLRRTGATLLLLATAACSSVESPSTPAAEDAAAAADRAAAVFFDDTRPKPERLAAARQLDYGDDERFADLLAVGTDRSQDDDLRWAALRRHRFDGRYVNAVVAILEDPSDGGEQLNADLIQDLGRRSLRIPPELTQKIVATLRDLLDDPRMPVRIAAFNVLVSNHDTVAVGRLTDSLRTDPATVPIPAVNAIRLLYLDGSVFHLEVLRPFLDHPQAEVRAEAAQALAIDPDSQPRIVELATDPSTEPVVRLLALPALAREDAGFEEYGLRLLANGQEDPAVRRATMKAYVARMNYSPVDPKTQIRFAETVEQVSIEPGAPAGGGALLRREARELLVYLRKAFPAIEAHYAPR